MQTPRESVQAMGARRLTNLQFVVLGALRGGAHTGRQIRDRLAEFGLRKSGPAFYQMMSRLEEAGLIDGWYTQEIIGGQIIRERNYRLQASGESSWERERDFNLQVIERFNDVESPA